MDTYFSHSMFERRPMTKSKAPAVKWFKQWVPQDVIATGGKCRVLKWVNEATLNAIKEKSNEPEIIEPEPEPTTEVLFLCSYEGCGKTFIDAGALKKHSHIHSERQCICHYENCGKKFLDSSKLKRHFLIHTGERHFVCPHEGCGKAFSLDFNLRSHMKTHSQENYHICPYPECGKRYAHEYKLKNHIAYHHEKSIMDAPKHPPPAEKPTKLLKPSGERPYACPYDGCEKAYIHEYKLNLHLRREHPGHFPKNDNIVKKTEPKNENEVDEGSDPDAYGGKRAGNTKAVKQSKRRPNKLKPQPPPAKVPQRKSSVVTKKGWPSKEEDSAETEEERENMEGAGWLYGENNKDGDEEDDDGEETEYDD